MSFGLPLQCSSNSICSTAAALRCCVVHPLPNAMVALCVHVRSDDMLALLIQDWSGATPSGQCGCTL